MTSRPLSPAELQAVGMVYREQRERLADEQALLMARLNSIGRELEDAYLALERATTGEAVDQNVARAVLALAPAFVQWSAARAKARSSTQSES